MILCFDIGNTLIKIGLFDEKALIKKAYLLSKEKYSKKDYVKKLAAFDFGKIDRVCYSSVAPRVDAFLIDAIKELYKCDILVIDSKCKSDIAFEIDNKNELGSDLFAALVSVKERYGYPSIIADLGTANKVLVLDNKGAFVSAFISSGMETSVQSLFSNTDLLPNIQLKNPENFLAKNTIDAINNGVTLTNIEYLKGIANQIEQHLGYKCKRFLTGGYSKLVKDTLKNEYVYDEDIVLYGLFILINKN